MHSLRRVFAGPRRQRRGARLRVQRRLHGAPRRAVRLVWRRQIQDRRGVMSASCLRVPSTTAPRRPMALWCATKTIPRSPARYIQAEAAPRSSMRVADGRACLLILVASCTGASAASQCVDCEAGKYSATSSLSVYTDCVPGNFSAAAGLSTCAACPSGKFSEEAGESVCQSCSVGGFSPVRHTGHATGSASSLRARHAVPGAESQHPARDSGATQLRAGTGCTSCTTPRCEDWEFLFDCECSACPGECPAGREPSMSQECQCSDCAIDSSRPDNTAMFCTLCPPGKHQTRSGMATCNT